MIRIKTLSVAAVILGLGYVALADEGSQEDKRQAKRDRLHAAVQKICPVSGMRLGEHGAPIKVKVGKETLFLCCKACLKRKIDPRHWAKIHANFAKAQRICPVMKHELPKKPKWTIVEGQIVYVCCPPCTKKVEADPKAYLKAIDGLYAAWLESERKRQ
jgi:YHS domain-containing protein